MKQIKFKFSVSSTDFYFAGGISQLRKITDPKATVIITDQHVYKAHTKRFRGWNTIVLKAGEDYKALVEFPVKVKEVD